MEKKRKIDAEALMALLKIKKEQAIGKIQYSLRKRSMPEESIEIDVDLISEDIGIDLQAIIENVKKKFLSTQSTREWILAYPKEKLKLDKKTRLYPSSISIPKSVGQFLSNEDQDWIILQWYAMYGNKGNKNELIVFKKYKYKENDK